MKMIKLAICSLVLLIISFVSCNFSDKNSISTDVAVIGKGEKLFDQYCTGCHNFGQSDIGPQLNGITEQVPVDWIRRFITNPQEMIDSGDKHANEIYKKYNTIMPSFNTLTVDEINGIIAFLHTKKKQ